MCGEKFPLIAFQGFRLGSPPHVRGKELPLLQVGALAGITPACAGKRPTNEMIDAAFGDHPRMCGEKTKVMAQKLPK